MDAMEHIKNNTPENQVRVVFNGECGRLEQAFQQGITPTPKETREMEFFAVDRILRKAAEVGLITINI